MSAERDGGPDKNLPSEPVQPSIWPESQDIVSQQDAANKLFKAHTEQLNANRSQAQTQNMPEPTQRPHGNYNDLKLEHAEAGNKNAEEPNRDASERKLHFVKDAGRPNRASLKLEHARGPDEEPVRGSKSKQRSGGGEQKALHFVKDGPRPNYAKLKKEDAERSAPQDERKKEEPNRTLHFVKDRNRGRDYGR